MQNVQEIEKALLTRYPELRECEKSIRSAFECLQKCFSNGQKLLLCGNGGSCADCDHIAGELLKGFCRERPLNQEQKNFLQNLDPQRGADLAEKLQQAFPVVNLCANGAAITAIANDTDADLIFAQQLMGLGAKGDVLLCVCPKGCDENVLTAIAVARLKGMEVVGMTAQSAGKMRDLCDVLIAVPEQEVYLTQELHLPVYHALCLMLEANFFEKRTAVLWGF